jgi:hypothetical protein
MALNLEKSDKSSKEFQYYYSANGNSFGPFVLSVLLTKIGADSLVYREGIEWTKAADVPELKKFFENKSNANANTASTAAQPIPIEKKGNSSISRVIALIALMAVGFFGYKYYKKDSPVVTPVVNEISRSLNDYEIFDFEAVKKYTPTSDQENTANQNLNQARDSRSRNDFYNAITQYKESLKNAPKANVYLELFDMYWQVADFSKCESCAIMASNLDYQPRAEIIRKIMQVHAIQNNFGVLNNEVRTQSASDNSILNFIETDSIFRNFRKSDEYVGIIESNSIADSTSNYYSAIISYYNDLNNGYMNAFAYFSPQVEQYITMRNNVTPDDINVLWENNSEFLNGNSRIIGRMCFVTAPNKREVWIEFKCYRASKQKMQDCRVKVEFGFDSDGMILSYKELQVKDVKFY